MVRSTVEKINHPIKYSIGSIHLTYFPAKMTGQATATTIVDANPSYDVESSQRRHKLKFASKLLGVL